MVVDSEGNNPLFLISHIQNLMKQGIPDYKWGYVKVYWNVAGSPVITHSIANERLVQAGLALPNRYTTLPEEKTE